VSMTGAARIAAMPGAAMVLWGFGSSDCRCDAHLYWFEDAPSAAVLRGAVGIPVMTEPGLG